MGISNITGLVFYGEILFFFAAAKEKQGGICQRNSKSTGKHTLFSTWWQLKYVFYPDYSGNDPFWRAYSPNGLKPPSRLSLEDIFKSCYCSQLYFSKFHDPKKHALDFAHLFHGNLPNPQRHQPPLEIRHFMTHGRPFGGLVFCSPKPSLPAGALSSSLEAVAFKSDFTDRYLTANQAMGKRWAHLRE